MTSRDFDRQMREFTRVPGVNELPRIVEITDHAAFVHGLSQYVAPLGEQLRESGSVPPALLDLIDELTAMLTAFASGGSFIYLTQGSCTGATVIRGIAACETVGATRATEYLRAIAAAFPDGTMPEDEGEFSDSVFAIDESLGDGSAWQELDKEFPDAIDDLATAARAHLRPRIPELIAMRSALE